jgi:hypothetical protein
MVYLVIQNVGANRASDIELSLSPFLPSPLEAPNFQHVFDTQDGGSEEFQLNIAGADLKQGDAILVPLAAVTVFTQEDGSQTFIGIGGTRKPASLRWSDEALRTSSSDTVRDVDTLEYRKGNIPWAG